MRVNGLIDTGAILALLDADDRWHEPCSRAVEAARLPLGTTAAVLTELFHLIGPRPRDMAAAWRFIRSGAVMVMPIQDNDLPVIETLMNRYADRPMDFADASLVNLAHTESTNRVITIDHDDFETYRVGVRPFHVQPARFPQGVHDRE